MGVGSPFPSPGHQPNLGAKPSSPVSQAALCPLSPREAHGKGASVHRLPSFALSAGPQAPAGPRHLGAPQTCWLGPLGPGRPRSQPALPPPGSLVPSQTLPARECPAQRPRLSRKRKRVPCLAVAKASSHKRVRICCRPAAGPGHAARGSDREPGGPALGPGVPPGLSLPSPSNSDTHRGQTGAGMSERSPGTLSADRAALALHVCLGPATPSASGAMPRSGCCGSRGLF